MSDIRFIQKKLDIDSNKLLSLLTNNSTGFLLESSLDNHNLGRYSFFGVRPFLTVEYKNGVITKNKNGKTHKSKGNIFWALRELLNKYQVDTGKNKSGIPFLGGAVGFMSYDLGFYIEKIKRENTADLDMPDLWFGFFDTALCIDRYKNELSIFSYGLSEDNPASRKSCADHKVKSILKELDGLGDFKVSKKPCKQYKLKSNFTKKQYINAVDETLDYITRGDIYQINLSQRFNTKTDLTTEELYYYLKKVFPVPFGGILKTEDFSLVSGSPERFIKYEGDSVITRPMKGTRPRFENSAMNKKLRKELELSKKDKAELLMIVDLERNDLGRVCDYGSVKVDSLRNIEEYNTVFQTTAEIRGRLYPDRDRIDVIKACFPGGSITGCPKIRAMQIIEELEPTRRSFYTGSLGYFSFSGSMDFNILIRSFLKKDKDIYFGVGGGIVYDSDPESEYEETLVKAKALMQALRGGS